ncbi:MAG: VOC family protein, partial [Actinocatenispora sp.]
VAGTVPAGGGAPAPVCLAAVGLGTTDQVGALHRAQAYLAREVVRRRAPSEIDLPSVRATDGTTFLFCGDGEDGSPTWLDDFVAQPSAGHPGHGLTRIDHVAVSLPFDQFDAAVLFARSVLGMVPGESTELAAPYGLVREHALETGDGTVRLMVGTTQPGTTACAGHVALGCEDIVTTAEALRAAGAPILPVPANYYDDLDARYAIDPGDLARMRRLDVLYDRTADGEFLHLCTGTLGGGLFLEVVQRVGGYAGYGSANTPVRLAAQTQAEARRARPSRRRDQPAP